MKNFYFRFAKEFFLSSFNQKKKKEYLYHNTTRLIFQEHRRAMTLIKNTLSTAPDRAIHKNAI